MDRILVIQTAFLGDAVLTLPLIQKIKDKFPKSKIDVVAIPTTAELFDSSPAVNKVWIYDKKGEQKSVLKLIKFAAEIRREGYSKIISPHKSFRTSVLVWLSQVRDTAGFDTASFKSVYKKLVEYREDFHEVRRNLLLLAEEFASEENWRIKPEISFEGIDTNSVEEVISKFNKDIIAIAPGSVWETKKYPAEYFVSVGQKLQDKFQIVLIGGEADFKLCEEIKQSIGANVINLSGSYNVVQSVYLLSKCRLLISNDSAPTHLAMAAGIPVLTIYLSTVPQFGFYPYLHGGVEIGYDKLECKPCGIHGYKKCPTGTFDCGKLLLPEIVLDKINSLLGLI